MYVKGHNSPVDNKKAFYWFHKAAEQGEARAQYHLSFMYANNLGVPKDLVKAYQWMSLAAKQGDELASQNIANLSMLLTVNEFAEGERIAAECFLKNYKGCVR